MEYDLINGTVKYNTTWKVKEDLKIRDLKMSQNIVGNQIIWAENVKTLEKAEKGNVECTSAQLS